jgi:hypothetical protein
LNVKGNEVIKYTVSELSDVSSGDVISIYFGQEKGELWFVLHEKNIGPVIQHNLFKAGYSFPRVYMGDKGLAVTLNAEDPVAKLEEQLKLANLNLSI